MVKQTNSNWKTFNLCNSSEHKAKFGRVSCGNSGLFDFAQILYRA